MSREPQIHSILLAQNKDQPTQTSIDENYIFNTAQIPVRRQSHPIKNLQYNTINNFEIQPIQPNTH